MYNPENFISRSIVFDVLSDFFDPKSFQILGGQTVKRDVIAQIGNCYFLFREGFESDMEFYISNSFPPATKFFNGFKIVNLIYMDTKDSVVKEGTIPIESVFPFASRDKVTSELREIIKLIKDYMMPCIEGDFSKIHDFIHSHGEQILF